MGETTGALFIDLPESEDKPAALRTFGAPARVSDVRAIVVGERKVTEQSCGKYRDVSNDQPFDVKLRFVDLELHAFDAHSGKALGTKTLRATRTGCAAKMTATGFLGTADSTIPYDDKAVEPAVLALIK